LRVEGRGDQDCAGEPVGVVLGEGGDDLAAQGVAQQHGTVQAGGAHPVGEALGELGQAQGVGWLGAVSEAG